MPTLALCMIVKNEEEMLAGCLESVKGIVDEMVVVDTGSTDNTKQIALDAGAKVFDFEWINDFAAARNYAKSKTDCDFILALDADERLVLESIEDFKSEFVQQNATVGMIPLTNVSPDVTEFDVYLQEQENLRHVLVPRIVRNIVDVEWVGRIHEVPNQTYNSFYSKSNIVHLGASMERRQERNKNDRNLQLLELSLLDGDRDDPLFFSYLAIERKDAGNIQGAEDAIRMGWEALDNWLAREDENEQKAELSLGILVTYPYYLLNQGRTEDAMENMQQLMSILHRLANPNNSLSVMVNSILLSNIASNLPQSIILTLLDSVEFMIEHCEEAFFEPTLPTLNRKSLVSQKLQLLLLAKQFNTFNEFIQSIQDEFVDVIDVALWKVEGLIEQGELLNSFESWFELVDRFGYDTPDVWVLGSVILLGLHKEEDAESYLKNALNRGAVDFVSSHRFTLLQSLFTRMAVLKGEPYSGNGTYGVIGAILSRQPVLSERTVPSSIIHQVVDQYVSLNQVELLLRFFDSRAEKILPGVGDIVKSRLTEFGFELVDDNEPTPIVLFGTCLEDVLQIFRLSTEVCVIELSDEDKEDLDNRIVSFQDQAMEDLFSAGMNFLDMEEESTSPLNDFFQVKLNGVTERPLIIWDPAWPIEMLSDFLPSKQMMVYLGDPAKKHSKEQDLLAWNQMNIEVFQAVGGDLFFSNLKHMSSKKQDAIDEMFAYFGLPTLEEGVHQISFDSTCLQTLETEYAAGVERDILTQWKFMD